jgi:prephenate dehydrogenase
LSEAAMWRDILLANADNVLEAARELSLELERLTSAVGAGRGDEVLGQMESGRRAALAIRESMA